MDEQIRFKTALAALSAGAEQRNRKLQREEVEEFFRDMNLSPDQYPLVYAYLASKRIEVEGVELPNAREKVPYTEEEQEFLKQYQRAVSSVRRQEPDALQELFIQAAGGMDQAKELLTEHYMDWVLSLAEEYAHQGLLIQDLVQEGNLGLVLGIDTLGLMEEGLAWEAHLEREIRRAIRTALDEQENSRSTGEQVTEKLNKLADIITELTEDFGRQVTTDEVSVYLDMPPEELEELLRIAGETIELADREQ